MFVKYEDLIKLFTEKLVKHGVEENLAREAATIFADNSRDGVYTHGTNRFPRIIRYIDEKVIDFSKVLTEVGTFNAFAKYDGHRGFGPLNAKKAMQIAIDKAKEYGIGGVCLVNNNHWLRGGTYGELALENNMVGICFTNSTGILPPWGGKEPKLGNNPLVMAVPCEGKHILMDMAISQYSYGKLEETRLKGQKLPYPGGYDENGNLTTDPGAIEKSLRALPIGYWKGSSLALLLDLILAVFGAMPTKDISKQKEEVGLSQMFIAIDPTRFESQEYIKSIVDAIIEDVKSATPVDEKSSIRYPGEREYKVRKENLEKGIPVLDEVYKTIIEL